MFNFNRQSIFIPNVYSKVLPHLALVKETIRMDSLEIQEQHKQIDSNASIKVTIIFLYFLSFLLKHCSQILNSKKPF